VDTPIEPGERHEFAVADGKLRSFDAESGLARKPAAVGS
jgi:hypothetical protein